MARRKKTTERSTRFVPTFESLEQRQLLAANVLANGLLEDINLSNTDDVHTLQLEVNATEPVILALDLHGQGGLNPGQIGVVSISGHTIAPLASTNGSTDSTFLAELGPGSYEITVLADGGTTGSYDFSVSLVGDLDTAGYSNGDGVVTSFEQMWTQAAIAQARGSLNSYTAAYYSQFGIPVGQNLYDLNLDANRNGSIDPTDYSCVTSNVGKAGVTVKLINDNEAPVLNAGLVNDTGVSDTDSITSDITIDGTVTDKSEIAVFKAGIDGMSEANYVDIRAEVDANGNFTLDRAELEAIAGASLDDGQEHTLHLIAVDEHDNGLGDASYTVNFTLDTEVLTTLTQDLHPDSDTDPDGDQYTEETTVTIEGTTHANTKLSIVGTDLTTTSDASGNYSFTDLPFVYGENEITIRAESALGGVYLDSTVTYDQNNTPTATPPTTPYSYTENDGAKFILLTDIFSDLNTNDGDTLTFELVSSTNDTLFTDTPFINTTYPNYLDFEMEGTTSGTTTITIRATDSYGKTVDASFDIEVTAINDAPVQATDLKFETDKNVPVTIDLWDYFEDEETADADLVFSNVTSGTGADGTYTLRDGHFVDFVPTTGVTGLATFNVTVVDEAIGGDANTITKLIQGNIVNQNIAPTANDRSSDIIDEDPASPVEIPVGDLVSDLETSLDDLTITILSNTGGTAEVVEISGVRYFRFTPTTDFNGQASFEYQVTDEAVGTSDKEAAKTVSGTVSITINPINDTPVAASPSLNIDEDGGTLNILIEDLVTDIETDIDDLNISTPTLSDTSSGTLTETVVDGKRAFSFTPAQDYNGTVSFTYTVTDTGDGTDTTLKSDSGTVTITVNPVNDAPTIISTPSLSTTEDTIVADLDLRTLVDDFETSTDQLIFTIADETNGSVTLVDGHIVQFMPSENFNDSRGTASFTYTVTDSGDGSAAAVSTGPITITVSVSAVNDAPVATDDGTASQRIQVPIDQDSTIDVLANDYDPDNANGETDTLTILSSPTIVEADSGTVVVENGKLKYSPKAGATEAYTVTINYTIEDSAGLQDSAVLYLDVVPNQAPIAGDDSEDTPENTPASGNVLTNDSDPDGDTFTITAFDATSNKGISVTVNSDGSFLYDLSASNLFNGLAAGESDTDFFTYTISDGKGGVTTGTVTITITGENDAPIATNDTGFSVDENASVNGNVLTNDSDSDTNDTLTVTGHDATTAKGIAISVNSDGSFTYDLTSSTVFDSLGNGDSDTDTFSYTISDGNGGTDTATVTITIDGVNDAPIGTNDSDSTNKNTLINIDVLDNDSDVDSTNLTVTNLQTTSARGATVTLKANGTVDYDPTSSSELQGLASGQQLTDTFTYTVNDGSLNSQTVTVSITVNGHGNAAPQVDNPIANMSLNDGDAQPSVIDLTSVFSDPNGHTLSYNATTSNPELVNVQIVNGTELQVTYAAYTTGQDRTPATITVTATETDSGESLSVNDEFTVTVAPIQPMEVYLVVVSSATDSTTAEGTTTLPTEIDTVDIGSSYVVEIWLKNSYPNGISHVAVAQGDLGFDNTLGSATSISHAGPFDTYTMGSINNNNGVVDNFGGVNDSAGVAVQPNYSRLGYANFNATDAGSQHFTFNVDTIGMLGGGAVLDPSQISVTEASITHEVNADSYTFDLLTSTTVSASGKIGGVNLAPEPNDAAFSHGPSGSLVVTLDDYNSPTTMTVLSGSLDVEDYDGGPTIRPGVGGIDSADYGDFGLSNSSIELAVRDLVLSFDSNAISLTGSTFDPLNINTGFTSGTIDYRLSNGTPGTIDLKTLNSSTTVISSGLLTNQSGAKEMTFDCKYTFDLSSIFGANSEISFTLSFTAENDPTPPIMGTVSAEDTPTDVAMSVVTVPTITDAKGEVASLPQSEVWIDEWDAHWVEVWVKTEEGSGVGSANVDLKYNAEYFTATEIEYSPAVIGDFSGDILTDGIVSGLGGKFDSSGLGVDGYVLLGRVKFESLDGDGIELDVESFGVKPFDLGLELSVNDLNVNGVVQATVGIDRAPTTELWAMPYDINDDNAIDLLDVAEFVALFQTNVLSSSNALAQVVDYNNDAKVDLLDMSHLLANFRITKASGLDVSFPETFTQRWIGGGLDTTGDSTAGQLLDAATEMWQNMLGTDAPIDIQLVVTDLGGKQLAEAEILATDENGQPIAGRLTIDDDAAGLGWYSQVDGTPDAEMYDLYTVMLHEIGHTLGFMGSYDGFAEYFDLVDGQVTFVDEGISVTMDNAGNHIADTNLSDDLMSSTLDPGVRKLPSELDAQMILAAYEAASGGASGFAAVSAAITAADAMEAASITTTDFNQLDGPLVGEMTWDRLFETRSEKNEEELDATDAWFTYETIDTPVAPIQNESDTDLELNDDLAINFAEELTEEATTDEAIDSVFDDWSDLLG